MANAQAAKPQGPMSVAHSREKTVQAMAKPKPQRPGIRPEGIGRLGSLMASTCRSNQSFTAWLLAQTSGPVSTKPNSTNTHCALRLSPEATTPQAKAHMGGNQVMGLSSSATVRSEGRRKSAPAVG